MRDNASKLLGIILVCCAFSSSTTALANAACEQKLADTKMWVLKSDPKAICDSKPTAAVQTCMVNLLLFGKGKLRNQDFVQVYGLCDVDSSQAVQNCFKKHLVKPFNDPGYKDAQTIANLCLMDRAKSDVKFLHKTNSTARSK